jgi:nitrogen fixation protein NifB
MPTEIWDKVKNHPCYSEEAHHHFARMHVAVAPACNIQCNYCNRKYDCSNEPPGCGQPEAHPDQAVKKVLAVASEIPR